MTSPVVRDLGTIYRLMPAHRRRQLFLVAVLMPLTALAEMAMVGAIVPFVALLTGGTAGTSGGYFLGGLIGRIQDFSPQQPLPTAAAIFAAAVLVTAALRLTLTHSSQRFAFSLGHDLSVELQRRILHQPYLFHIERHSSELLAVLGKIDHLTYNLVLQSLQAASAALIGLFVVAVLGSIDPLSTSLAALLIGGFYGLTLLVTRRRIEAHARVIGESYDQRLKTMQESLAGIRDVIIDRSQDLLVERFRIIDLQSSQARVKAMFLAAAPRFLIEAIGLVLIAALAVVIAGRTGGIAAALPILGALTLGALRLLPLASQFYGGWVSLGSSGPILREVVDLIRLPMPPNPRPAAAPQFAEAIRLDSVRFHYPGRALPALNDLSLVIPKGSRVAVTGKTGSGKSTLADLLMGLIEPDEGTISVDRVALSGQTLTVWRQSIANVSQTIFLADANIADNIAMALPEANIDIERVKAAAEGAQLAEFIASLPDGYDTRIGERGVRLSGGQRQRLALARAIYKQAPLLVLDEATSALDDATEAAVLAALDELHGEGRTIVIIAHRMSTVARCDPIFVLEEGQLAQSGSFDELFGPLSKLKQEGEL